MIATLESPEAAAQCLNEQTVRGWVRSGIKHWVCIPCGLEHLNLGVAMNGFACRECGGCLNEVKS